MELRNKYQEVESVDFRTVSGQNTLLRASFSWMALAMLLTAVAAWGFSAVPQLTSLLIQETDQGQKMSIFGWVVMFAPLLFVMGISFGFARLSYPALVGLFIAYAAINGISFSFLFRYYDLGSIVKVFLSTTALFGVMAVAGYTTKTDLTSMGRLLMIGVIGIVIAMLINLFLQSERMDYIVSILGVIIFTGLTAYDVQKIKNLGMQAEGSAMISKLGIMGALTLYLDFINLFLFLLRLFGGKRE